MSLLLSYIAGFLQKLLTNTVYAQVFNGGGVQQGVNATNSLKVPTNVDFRTLIEDIIKTILNFLALAAVVMIIIAGLFLIFSLGSETARDRAKNIILYTIVGLVVIFLSEVIINLVFTFIP